MRTIRVRTCLAVPGHAGDDVPYSADVNTIGKLLRLFGDRIGSELTDRDGAIMKDLDVRINGKDLCFCPEGLETPISPEDDIEIYFRPLGGG